MKGWRKPAGAVYVGRPSLFGNPFPTVEEFRDWLSHTGTTGRDSDDLSKRRATLLSRLGDLRGKTLMCWCNPAAPCHADVLLELANRPHEPT